MSIVVGTDGLLHHSDRSFYPALRPVGAQGAGVCGASFEERVHFLDQITSPLDHIASRKTCEECLRILGPRRAAAGL